MAAINRSTLPHVRLLPQLYARRRRPASSRLLLRTSVHRGATDLHNINVTIV